MLREIFFLRAHCSKIQSVSPNEDQKLKKVFKNKYNKEIGLQAIWG